MITRAMTTDELTYVRRGNQHSKLYLAGTEAPKTVFACRANQVFSTHDKIAQATYDTVTTGAYTDVLVGQTVWVGSAAGLYDIGQARIRKTPTSSILYLSEGSEIAWEDNLYLTVVDEMGIWAKHIRMLSQVPQMDYDVAYATPHGQHEYFDPIPIMGANVVLDVAAYPVTVTFPDAVNSSVYDSSISSWLWTATSTSVSWTGSTTNNPTLTINSRPTDGYIRVALKLNSARGKEFTGYRYIRVYNSTHRPVTNFTLEDCSGGFDEGGFSFSVTMYGSATKSLIRDRAPMTLFADDYYGATKISLGQAAGRENIVCTGWIDGESISENPILSTVTFTVQGAQFWLDKITGFPVGVELGRNYPAAWTSMTALTVNRALWHLFHWRSTLTAVCDVMLTGDSRYALEMSSAAGSLMEQARDGVLVNLCEDWM